MEMDKLQEIKEQLDRIEQFSMIPFKETLTLCEAAVYTGLSKAMLYDMTHKNKITYYKPGGKTIYIEKSELDKWMRRGCIHSNDYLETQAANRLYKQRQ